MTHRIVRCARSLDRRIGYLGEWHTHPADLGASITDVTTMINLRGAGPEIPTMILLRKQASGYRALAYQFEATGAVSYALVTTGNLPLAADAEYE